MSETTPSHTDLTQKLNEVLESYFAQNYRDKCYLGLLFQQGKRKMVQINVPAHDLPILLQAKPSTGNDPDSGKNRPEVQGHTDEVKQYILDRIKKNKPWILGTLTANVDPTRIKLIELARGICFVIIPRGVKLDITDGQHRKRAIHELIESSHGELIGDNDFSITLVLEENFKQCQTDFRDMAQTKKLDRSLLLSFGEFEGKVGITKSVLDEVQMFKHKTEKVKDSPAANKKLIYTFNYVARMISCAFANDPSVLLEDFDVEQASSILINSLNKFFSESSQTKLIAETDIEDLTIQQIKNFKEGCILGRSVGLEVLGRLFYYAYDETNGEFESLKISQLAKLDCNRSGGVEIW
jgi:DNA sulfur modification protein DndB